MPALQALHLKYGSRGLTLVGVSIDESGAGKVRKYVSSKKLTYPIAMDDATAPAWEAFRVKAVPAAYLLDRQGRIVVQWTGAAPEAATLDAEIAALLAVE